MDPRKTGRWRRLRDRLYRRDRLAGETVPVGERFRNGADWPGDSFSLPVSEVANCHCEVVVTLLDPESESSPLDATKRKRGA